MMLKSTHAALDLSASKGRFKAQRVCMQCSQFTWQSNQLLSQSFSIKEDLCQVFC